ncbi:MAG: aminotransferase class III-fold pyridoxal phosphate-dependent enzyme, partial [Nocardioides sp.]
FWGGQTYAGHPLACASGIAALTIMEEEGLVENARKQGERLRLGLEALAEKHPSIGDIRGRGLFFGVELVRDRETREPLVPFNGKGDAAAPITAVTKDAWSKGLYLTANNNVLRITPPLVIDETDIDLGLSILDDSLHLADKSVV